MLGLDIGLGSCSLFCFGVSWTGGEGPVIDLQIELEISSITWNRQHVAAPPSVQLKIIAFPYHLYLRNGLKWINEDLFIIEKQANIIFEVPRNVLGTLKSFSVVTISYPFYKENIV